MHNGKDSGPDDTVAPPCRRVAGYGTAKNSCAMSGKCFIHILHMNKLTSAILHGNYSTRRGGG